MTEMRALSLLAALAAGCATNQSVENDREADRDDGEQTVSIDQLPPAASATLVKEAGGGTIDEIDKEKNGGRWVYSADVIINGRKWEIEVAEDGKLIEKELDNEKDGEDDKDD